MNHAKSEPQFSQSFSSSSAVGPDGEIINNSIYTDSDGNRIINGENLKSKPSSPSNSVQLLTRPDWNDGSGSSSQKVDTGAYVHDNRGAYTGN